MSAIVAVYKKSRDPVRMGDRLYSSRGDLYHFETVTNGPIDWGKVVVRYPAPHSDLTRSFQVSVFPDLELVQGAQR